MFLQVSSEIRTKRIATCEACVYYNKTTRSCGTLGFPQNVGVGRTTRKLCGCFIPLKATLKIAKCPLGKWDAQIDADIMRLVVEFTATERAELNATEIQILFETYNKANGTNRKYTGCKSCVREIYAEMKKLAEDWQREQELTTPDPEPPTEKKRRRRAEN